MAYAFPFFDLSAESPAKESRRHSSSSDGNGAVAEYERWFEEWIGSIQHLLHLLAPTDDTRPLLGFDQRGAVVSANEASAPPMPLHPFPPAAPHHRPVSGVLASLQPLPPDDLPAGVDPDSGFFSDFR